MFVQYYIGQSWHWTGSDGVPAILLRKGWKKVSKSNLQPGDVLNANTVHVLIYAGKGIMYDQSCAVYSSSGTPPIGGPLPASRYNYYMNNPAYEAYRAP